MQRQPEDKFVLRLPEGMRGHIKERAQSSGRTMTAEIIHRIKEAYNAEEMNKRKMKAAEILGGTSGLL